MFGLQVTRIVRQTFQLQVMRFNLYQMAQSILTDTSQKLIRREALFSMDHFMDRPLKTLHRDFRAHQRIPILEETS